MTRSRGPIPASRAHVPIVWSQSRLSSPPSAAVRSAERQTMAIPPAQLRCLEPVLPQGRAPVSWPRQAQSRQAPDRQPSARLAELQVAASPTGPRTRFERVLRLGPPDHSAVCQVTVTLRSLWLVVVIVPTLWPRRDLEIHVALQGGLRCDATPTGHSATDKHATPTAMDGQKNLSAASTG